MTEPPEGALVTDEDGPSERPVAHLGEAPHPTSGVEVVPTEDVAGDPPAVVETPGAAESTVEVEPVVVGPAVAGATPTEDRVAEPDEVAPPLLGEPAVDGYVTEVTEVAEVAEVDGAGGEETSSADRRRAPWRRAGRAPDTSADDDGGRRSSESAVRAPMAVPGEVPTADVEGPSPDVGDGARRAEVPTPFWRRPVRLGRAKAGSDTPDETVEAAALDGSGPDDAAPPADEDAPLSGHAASGPVPGSRERRSLRRRPRRAVQEPTGEASVPESTEAQPATEHRLDGEAPQVEISSGTEIEAAPGPPVPTPFWRRPVRLGRAQAGPETLPPSQMPLEPPQAVLPGRDHAPAPTEPSDLDSELAASGVSPGAEVSSGSEIEAAPGAPVPTPFWRRPVRLGRAKSGPGTLPPSQAPVEGSVEDSVEGSVPEPADAGRADLGPVPDEALAGETSLRAPGGSVTFSQDEPTSSTGTGEPAPQPEEAAAGTSDADGRRPFRRRGRRSEPVALGEAAAPAAPAALAPGSEAPAGSQGDAVAADAPGHTPFWHRPVRLGRAKDAGPQGLPLSQLPPGMPASEPAEPVSSSQSDRDETLAEQWAVAATLSVPPLPSSPRPGPVPVEDAAPTSVVSTVVPTSDDLVSTPLVKKRAPLWRRPARVRRSRPAPASIPTVPAPGPEPELQEVAAASSPTGAEAPVASSGPVETEGVPRRRRRASTGGGRPRQGSRGPAPARPASGASGRSRATGAALVLVALVGLGGSVLVGQRWDRTVGHEARQAFAARAAAVASSLSASLQRDTDLATSAAAVVGQDAQLSNAGLAQWFGALTRHPVPGALGVAEVEPVAASSLFGFRVGLAQDPTSALDADSPFTVLPSQGQADLCLVRLLALTPAVQSAADAALPPGLDWCATSWAGVLTQARDSGQATVAPALAGDEAAILGFAHPGTTLGAAQTQTLRAIDAALDQAMVIMVPVYGGAAPATVAGRQAAFTGWVATFFDAAPVLAQAAGAQPGLVVTLAHQSGAGQLTIASHATTALRAGAADTVRSVVDGSWTVTVSGLPSTGWASAPVQGGLAGGAVALATLVLVLVIALLARSRRRSDTARPAVVEDVIPALHDGLTGLPASTLVLDRTEQMLARSRRAQLPTAAVVLGLDDFADFNTRVGRAHGDQLLVAVGERLATVVREADTVGRLGDDRFVVLVDGATLLAGPELVAERILDILREPFVLADEEMDPVRISVSAGVALGPRLDAEALLRDAGLALADAKAAGKGRYALFGKETADAEEGRDALAAELRSAVAASEFFLRYQPIFDIDTRKTTGVEALLRWQHPTRKVIPPDHFLPMLEESGLMVPLGRWVLHEACRQGAALHAAGHRISMSVNLSPTQLEGETVATDLGEALAESGLHPHALIVEVNETTLMHNTELMVERLVAIKSLGVRIAIDDFGTGYSSLAFLRQFPIDILKIDRSLISSMASTRESSMLIHTLVQVGKTLGLEVVAEGIEEEGQIDPLVAEQCDRGQGFLYGRPLTPTQLDIFLRTHLTQDAPLWVVPPPQGAR